MRRGLAFLGCGLVQRVPMQMPSVNQFFVGCDGDGGGGDDGDDGEG
jgi:hypothetical protein